METKRIYTENPRADQWRMLAKYAYQANIQEELRKRGFASSDTKLVDFIASSFQQGRAYFDAAEDPAMDISPLLLYYGATNLLMGGAALVTGIPPLIKVHGMKVIPISEPHRIADIGVQPFPRETGGLQFLARVLSDGCKFERDHSWTMEDILGSIPDLRNDFESFYPRAKPRTIGLEVIKRKRASLERFPLNQLERYPSVDCALDKVAGFQKAYLTPQITSEFVVLYARISPTEIGTYSISGGKYLQIGHKKGKGLISPNQTILMYMGLFALGFLSRYKAELWNPFVQRDDTGERPILEKFLFVCQRYLPNLVLNHIQATRTQFVFSMGALLDAAEDNGSIM